MSAPLKTKVCIRQYLELSMEIAGYVGRPFFVIFGVLYSKRILFQISGILCNRRKSISYIIHKDHYELLTPNVIDDFIH